jgi:hypothetical protein
MYMDRNDWLRKEYLAGILEQICQELELTETQHQQAKERYGAVGRWLAGSKNVLLAGTSIYAHGSVALGTTVKPLTRNEHDVDLVCFLHGLSRWGNEPAEIKTLIGDRLREHGDYEPILEEKQRCWRLNYANSFHLDITPSISNPACATGGELVPDKKLKEWKPTNPKGYRDLFEMRANLQPIFRLMKSEGFRGDAAVEPYPQHLTAKGLLRRTVQLCKRHRDIHFGGAMDLAPISVIITTLAARSYEYCVQTKEFDSELDLLIEVVKAMPTFIVAGSGRWLIENETTSGENFAEKWNSEPKLAIAFFEWHRACVTDLDLALGVAGRDMVQKRLAVAFGPSTVAKAMQPITDRMSDARAINRLSVVPGIGLSVGADRAGTQVRPNTFFGR